MCIKNVVFLIIVIVASVLLAQTPCQLYDSSPLRSKHSNELTVAESDTLGWLKTECWKYRQRIERAAENADRTAAIKEHRRWNAVYSSVILGILVAGMVVLVILV